MSTGEGQDSRVWKGIRNYEVWRDADVGTLWLRIWFIYLVKTICTFANWEMEARTALCSLKISHTPSKVIQIQFQPIPVKRSTQFFLHSLVFKDTWLQQYSTSRSQPHNMMRSLRPISSSETARRGVKISQGLQPGQGSTVGVSPRVLTGVFTFRPPTGHIHFLLRISRSQAAQQFQFFWDTY